MNLSAFYSVSVSALKSHHFLRFYVRQRQKTDWDKRKTRFVCSNAMRVRGERHQPTNKPTHSSAQHFKIQLNSLLSMCFSKKSIRWHKRFFCPRNCHPIHHLCTGDDMSSIEIVMFTRIFTMYRTNSEVVNIHLYSFVEWWNSHFWMTFMVNRQTTIWNIMH